MNGAKIMELKPKSADDINEIRKHWPSAEQERKIADELSEFYSATNRAGARGIGSGITVPSVRPRGLRRASNFVDTYTPGKYKQPPRPFSKPISEEPVNPIKRELKEKLKLILPRNFCPDCGRTDRPSEKGAINVNMVTQDEEGLGLKAFDVWISFLCQECIEAALLLQQGKDGQIILPDEIKELRTAQRSIRIKENSYAFIAAKRASGDLSIYDVNVNE
jgi:hypothetical protein